MKLFCILIVMVDAQIYTCLTVHRPARPRKDYFTAGSFLKQKKIFFKLTLFKLGFGTLKWIFWIRSSLEVN